MGSRRGFICRMKVGNVHHESLSSSHLNRLRQRNSLGPSRDGVNHAVVHCTGYIKNWPPSGVPMDRGGDEDGHSHCCLVAIGRLQVTSAPNTSDMTSSQSAAEFITRHSIDGKFTFVDQRVMGVLGYTPQELLGKCCFDIFHPEDQTHMKESFEQGKIFFIFQHLVARSSYDTIHKQQYLFLCIDFFYHLTPVPKSGRFRIRKLDPALAKMRSVDISF